ncbi:murein transglycosylase D [Erwinia sp. OLTSP20]|uniref:murein transglycosylase D n=1 Tax=unclassified Erwinia TaxID=2622719 RepID=UPI000C17932C|nr:MULTISPECIES: murein transglycosylase D [unclassified Erwinia]PIJ48401.1 murein transglycosylase D [Erwinia sp. OAMSP11]PIJ67739.1 murein transglycosylase D [Erwinia sp. OLSSP12]PIJ78762.1 murein transglycosylase D [Erwinia sp. OLCASP19]PIJ79422.1 murein transglycosylase D [Erwinia sp. OLMTSP26]PIJ81291.1 murein transglycosylase D [Erwinia sp. OLMDSP33]
MKAKAILIASVLLAGCQASGYDANGPAQHAQSLSSPGEKGQSPNRMLSPRWQDDGTNLTKDSDLWTLIRDGLKMKVPDNPRIRAQRVNYLKNKSYLHDVTLRAEPYMYWIVEQIKQRKMPMELVLLPIVESAFNPGATSASNAAGIWQIVPATGRNYGLKQNQYYDGRRDIVASTRVALDMMQRMNKMFDGDWLLTIAAYNSGEGRVLNAVKYNKARGKPTDFWHLTLPRETTIYVPKMLALSQILKDNQRYGIRLPTPDESRALARVDVGQQIKLTQVAEMAGLPLSKLKSFNSGYKTSATAPNGPHYIMVPKSHVDQLRESLASTDIDAVQPDRTLADNSTRYKVRAGDTLSTIAQRLNVSVSSLKSSNNLRSAQLRAGQVLNVNRTGSALSLADNSSITYRVRRGDSLASIAKHHGVNIKDVMRWNSRVTGNIQPGEKLTLYVNANAAPES